MTFDEHKTAVYVNLALAIVFAIVIFMLCYSCAWCPTKQSDDPPVWTETQKKTLRKMQRKNQEMQAQILELSRRLEKP